MNLDFEWFTFAMIAYAKFFSHMDNQFLVTLIKGVSFSSIWIYFYGAWKIIESIHIDKKVKHDYPCNWKLWLIYFFCHYLSNYAKKRCDKRLMVQYLFTQIVSDMIYQLRCIQWVRHYDVIIVNLFSTNHFTRCLLVMSNKKDITLGFFKWERDTLHSDIITMLSCNNHSGDKALFMTQQT